MFTDSEKELKELTKSAELRKKYMEKIVYAL